MSPAVPPVLSSSQNAPREPLPLLPLRFVRTSAVRLFSRWAGLTPEQSEVRKVSPSRRTAWHQGQVGKDSLPYVEHPRAVARIVAGEAGRALAARWNVNLETARAAALLHDLLEDTAITVAAMYSAGLPDKVIAAAQALTHKKDEPYMTYIHRVKKNPIARLVKWADLQHNQDRSRLPAITESDEKRFEKYAAAERELLAEEPQR